MAVQRFKVALNAARFPLVSTKGQRAVFIPGLDAPARVQKTFMGDPESVDYNMAQVVYGENFMPVTEGLRSVGYSQLIAPSVNSDFNQIFPLRDADENVVLYSPSAGKNYTYDDAVGAWSYELWATIWSPTVVDPTLNPAVSPVTYAYVDGKTFVCYSRLKSNDVTPMDMSILAWNPATKSLDPAGALIANLPFAVGEIDGISSSNGYLIVWSGLAVAWAPFNGTAFDFTIYANGAFTGAGVQVPEDVKGPITACIAVPGGVIIFTSRNAVAASYMAQNLAAPWVFRAIPGAGGLSTYEQATVEGSLGYVIAYTTAGIQKISLNSAENDHSEVSDFIAGRQIERYNFATQTLSQAGMSLDLFTKITAVANRYIVISYGTFPGVFSYALVYDQTLKRWGKLRLVHKDCFYYNYGQITAPITYSMMGDISYSATAPLTYEQTQTASSDLVAAQHGMAFLLNTGEIKIAVWSDEARTAEDEAVVVIGRVQLTRTGNIQFNRAEVENMESGRVYVQPSYDGATLEPAIQLTEVLSAGNFRVFGDMIDCKNFNVVVEGTFNLSTMILEGVRSGSN
jgi:hypothetical protein